MAVFCSIGSRSARYSGVSECEARGRARLVSASPWTDSRFISQIPPGASELEHDRAASLDARETCGLGAPAAREQAEPIREPQLQRARHRSFDLRIAALLAPFADRGGELEFNRPPAAERDP